MAAAFPKHRVRAGQFDDLTGDFVPAVEVDVPMQLAKLVEGNDAIAFGTFSMVEGDLEAGRLAYLPTPRIEWRASYGFIFLRNRSPSRAALAYREGVREEERACAEREAHLEQRFGQREPSPANNVTMRMKSASEH